MQRTTAATLLISLTILSGCGKTLDFRNAELSNGSIYEAGENTPFSGKVTNIPYARLPVAPLGRIVQMTSTAAGGNQAVSELVIGNAVAAMLGNGNALLCDVQVSDGELDGDALCRLAATKKQVFELAFKENMVDGDVVIHDPANHSVKRAEASFVKGKLDGVLKIYSADGKVIVNSASFKDGLGEGTEEIRHPRTGKVIRQVNWTGGKQTGQEKTWNEEGVLLSELEWTDGKQSGVEKRYDETGKVLLADLVWKSGTATGMQIEHYSKHSGYSVYHLADGVRHGEHKQFSTKREGDGIYLSKVETYVNGNVDGKVTHFNEDGTVASTETYVAGDYVPAPATEEQTAQLTAANAACVDSKVAAFHAANGDDALVRADFLAEWESECKTAH